MRRPVQPESLFVALCAAHLAIGCTLASIWNVGLLLGALAAHCLLLGFWVYFVRPLFGFAIAVPLSTGFTIGATIAAATAFRHGGGALASAPFWILSGLCTAALYVVCSAMSIFIYCLAELLSGPVSFGKSEPQEAVAAERARFSLSQLFVWTGLAALAFALAHLLSTVPAAAASGAVLSAPLWIVAGMFALLLGRPPQRARWWGAAWSTLHAGCAVSLLVSGEYESLEVLWGVGSFAMLTLGTIAIVRACGYRLHGDDPLNSPSDLAPSPPAPAAPGP